MVPNFFTDGRLYNGLDTKSYYELFKNQVENPKIDTEKEKNRAEYRKLNLQRSQRIYKTYCPSNEISEVISSIDEQQYWMIITETWCGDSAQNIPYIEKIASLNSKIILRYILRDSNPDIMDLYLTDGKSRSIPKLVVFDKEGNELFQWGSRPKPAQELFENLIADDVSKDERNKQLHTWYAKNQGKQIEMELIQLLNAIKPVTHL